MKLLLIFISLLLPSLSSAAQFRCPDAIETLQQLKSKPVGTWIGMQDKLNGQQRLNRLDLFDGPPDEGASLAPDNEGSTDEGFWTFQKNKSRSIWLACSYSQSTVRLIQALPKSITKCTIILQSETPKGVDCR